jgi:hypothetical protein
VGIARRVAVVRFARCLQAAIAERPPELDMNKMQQNRTTEECMRTPAARIARGFRCAMALLPLLALPPRLAAAPPQVTLLFPAGGQQGETVSVEATGTFGWPLSGWADRAGIQITAEKSKGKLGVSIAPDAEPGLAWIRLYDDEGASAARPFVIGTLPEVVEAEPNNDVQKPQPLPSSAMVVHGQLARSNDVDTYAVPLARGQLLVAMIDANRSFGAPMDAVLQVVSPSGFVLAQNDDELGLDPLVTFTAPAEGTYLVRTFAFPAVPTSSISLAGGSGFVYRLTISTAGLVDYSLPLAVYAGSSARLELGGWNLPEDARALLLQPGAGAATVRIAHPQLGNTLSLPVVPHASIVEQPGSGIRENSSTRSGIRENSDESANVSSGATDSQRAEFSRIPLRDMLQVVELPATITGRISAAGETDAYAFTGTKGQRLSFRIESRELGYALDPYLALIDAEGKSLAAADDNGRTSRDAELGFTIPADGEYRITVRDLHRFGGPRFVYRLTAGPPRPDFTLKLAADSFLLTAGKPLEIPVTIERPNGFADAIEIVAEVLPEGVEGKAVTSEPKGNSAKAVKLVLTSSAGPVSGPFRIVGRSGESVRTAQAPIAGLSATVEDLWLTVRKP